MFSKRAQLQTNDFSIFLFLLCFIFFLCRDFMFLSKLMRNGLKYAKLHKNVNIVCFKYMSCYIRLYVVKGKCIRKHNHIIQLIIKIIIIKCTWVNILMWWVSYNMVLWKIKENDKIWKMLSWNCENGLDQSIKLGSNYWLLM